MRKIINKKILFMMKNKLINKNKLKINKKF